MVDHHASYTNNHVSLTAMVHGIDSQAGHSITDQMDHGYCRSGWLDGCGGGDTLYLTLSAFRRPVWYHQHPTTTCFPHVLCCGSLSLSFPLDQFKHHRRHDLQHRHLHLLYGSIMITFPFRSRMRKRRIVIWSPAAPPACNHQGSSG